MTQKPRRILITGSRDWTDRERMQRELRWIQTCYIDATLVHGDCRGADKMAGEIWTELGGKVEAHPARWGEHGKAAGEIRNNHMVKLGADLCIGFTLPQCRGTRNCMKAAADAEILVIEVKG